MLKLRKLFGMNDLIELPSGTILLHSVKMNTKYTLEKFIYGPEKNWQLIGGNINWDSSKIQASGGKMTVTDSNNSWEFYAIEEAITVQEEGQF